jgi:hypothetical protein
MKSSTAKLQKSAQTGRFPLTREQAEKISAVEGMVLTARMKRILDLPVSGEERRSLIKAQIRKK